MATFKVLQRGFGGVGSCLEISLGGDVLLVNCPEFIQRTSVESKVKFAKLKGILFTTVSASTFQGYPDIIMKVADLGDGAQKEIIIGGPPPLAKGIYSFVATLYRPDFKNLKFVQWSPQGYSPDSHHSTNTPDNDFLGSFPPLQVNGFIITPVYLEIEIPGSQIKVHRRDRYQSYSLCHSFDLKRTLFRDEESSPSGKMHAICYLIQSPEMPGKLDSQKAKKLGVPHGPLMGKLSKGESIEVDGKVINPEDCISPPIPGGVSIIIDCPNSLFIDCLLDNQCLKHYLSKDSGRDILSIVHMSPLDVCLEERYCNLFSSLPGKKTVHLFVSPQTGECPLLFPASSSLQTLLRSQFGSTCFPELYETCEENWKLLSSVKKKGILQIKSKYPPKQCHWGDILTFLQFHPQKKIKVDVKETKKYYDQFASNITKANVTVGKPPSVTFLGTSASIVSRYRGVSSILVETEKGSMIIDAGSGTYTQLLRLYGEKRCHELLNNLTCIFISHKHADHCQGVIQILSTLGRLKGGETLSSTPPDSGYGCDACDCAFDHETSQNMHHLVHHPMGNPNWEWDKSPTDSGKECKEPSDEDSLLIIGPMWIQTVIEDNRAIDPMRYTFIDAQDLTKKSHPLSDFFVRKMGIYEFLTVPMLHSYPTYGVVLSGGGEGEEPSWKMVYSADSRPSQSLMEAGRGATMLIHECTFDDEVAKRAVSTNHSTVTEALTVAKDMSSMII